MILSYQTESNLIFFLKKKNNLIFDDVNFFICYDIFSLYMQHVQTVIFFIRRDDIVSHGREFSTSFFFNKITKESSCDWKLFKFVLIINKSLNS